jgi:5-formyltetrahydrofolate cyclo-ligase
MATTKAALRHAALARRQALTASEVAQRSTQLCDQLFQHLPVAQWHWLHVFLSLARKNEPNTWPIIHRLWKEKGLARLAAPVVLADGKSLSHYELAPGTPLVASRWGIPEPVASPATEVPPALLDAVLVPLLACDSQGQRVGYGGGFYDRFLAQCRPGAIFIGLNILDEAPVDALADVLPTDVPLHIYLTPSGVWNFG